jgi:hypothetical protein
LEEGLTLGGTDQEPLLESSTEVRPTGRRRDTALAAGSLLFLVGWALVSQGRYEDDEAKHFLQALHGWSDWRILLDAWGRPGFTIPASIAAAVWGTYESMRVFGMICIWGAAMGAWRAASLLRLQFAWLTPIIICVTPTVLLTGAGAYTEPVFAAALAWGSALFLEKRYAAAALCLGWLPITRLEGALLLPPMALFFILRGAWLPMLLMGLPMAAWIGITALLSGDIMWVRNSVPYRVNQYGESVRGEWGHFARLMTELMTPPLLGALVVGTHFLARRRDGLPLVTMGLVYYLIQELAYYFAYGSAGYRRFLVGAIPIFALAAHTGLLAAAGYLSRDRQTVRLSQYTLAFSIILAASWFEYRPVTLVMWCSVALIVVLAADQLRHKEQLQQWIRCRLPWLGSSQNLIGILLLLSFLPIPSRLARPQEDLPFDGSIRRAAAVAAPIIEAKPDTYIVSTVFQFNERVGNNPFDRRVAAGSFTEGDILAAPGGSLIFWDSYFGPNLWHIHPDWWEARAESYELLFLREGRHNRPEVRLYRKRPLVELPVDRSTTPTNL